MFSIGQRAAVAAAWRLAGSAGVPCVVSVDSEDERIFVLEEHDVDLSDLVARDLEQVLQQLLGRKVAVVRRSQSWSPETGTFE